MQAISILFVVLCVALVSQLAATWIALRQMGNVTDHYRWAWRFIALALALMVERRLGPLWRLVYYGEASSLVDSLFGMCISLLMAVGFYHLKSLFAYLKTLAQTDTLTGLPNRYVVLQQAQNELERATRTKHLLAFLMFDIDHFKQVNDTYGHSAGDEVLRVVADIASNEFRRIDTVGRIGGEEFLVVLPESGQENATAAAERFRSSIASHEFSVGNAHIGITISIGLIVPDITTNTITVKDIMKAVDKALYVAKNDGHNRVVELNWKDR